MGKYPLIQLQGDNHEDKASRSCGSLSAPHGFSTYKMQWANLPTRVKELTEFTRLWNRSALLNRLVLFIEMESTEQSNSRPLQGVRLKCGGHCSGQSRNQDAKPLRRC
jgi:hypothetical protein